MLYYKNPVTGQVCAYETQEAKEEFGSPDLVLMTEAEVDAHIAASQPSQTQIIKYQIEQIERETLMNRAVREFMLANAEMIAASQGYTPEQLYQVNVGYRRVKDIDNQIAALRAQIGEA